jgi:hypothetical protein
MLDETFIHMNCKAIILEGENKGKICTRMAGEDGFCGKHRLGTRCTYIHPYGEHVGEHCTRRATNGSYCIHHVKYEQGQCKAVIEQGTNKGKQCTRPCMSPTEYCGKHQTIKHLEEIHKRGTYKCYTHRCTNEVAEERSYCYDCKEHKNTIIAAKQCQAIIMQGDRAGEKCINATDNKYCGKHAERSYLREYAKCMGMKLCDNGARCTELIDISKARCETCLAATREVETLRRKTKEEDTTKCYKCGKSEGFATGLNGKQTRYCDECYSKLRIVECKRSRPVSKQIPETYYEDYKRDATKKGRSFELTLETFCRIIAMPCKYCNVLKETEYNGIDRVDNTKNYTEDNCVAACKMCNRLKSDHTVQEFINHCISIKYYQTSHTPSKVRLIWPTKNAANYCSYAKRSSQRGLEFALSSEEFITLRTGQCYLCGTQGSIAKQNGIDRIDANKGYTLDNCASCCAWCNRFKNDSELEEFKTHCSVIASYNSMV